MCRGKLTVIASDCSSSGLVAGQAAPARPFQRVKITQFQQKIPHRSASLARLWEPPPAGTRRPVCKQVVGMRTTFLLAGTALIAAVIVGAWWLTRGPDASQFAYIREPRLTRMNDQRMLVVEAAGDPNVVGSSAFKLLFSNYFKLDGVSSVGRPPSPRARWPNPQGTPKDKWLGRYALQVPESVTTLAAEPTEGLRAEVA